ncbi:MAG TPA: GNAT family N-acetyltransferase [Thermomicrobiaceae bacterium]|nr:GNAT family N-acetyltransferase [Thermomicrobiaceae bacterium]
MTAPPILLDIPDSLETERLVLRAPRAGDGAALNAAIRESRQRLRPWLPFAVKLPSVAETEEWARRAAAAFIQRTALTYVLLLADDESVVGVSELRCRSWDVPSFELGYWCRTRFEGRGYVGETARALTRLAFEGLGANRVEIRMDARNERSRRVAERAGYRLEGTLHNDMRDLQGGLRDTLVFALLPDEHRRLLEGR